MTRVTTDAVRRTADAPIPVADRDEVAGFFGRQQHFETTASTNDVVRDWLAAGVPEVALATADEQTHGRGREGRTWQAPKDSSLLLSLGFRPTWLPPDRAWQLAGIVALAMADAAEEVAGIADGVIRLKWPNDLVIEFEREGPTGEGPTAERPAGDAPPRERPAGDVPAGDEDDDSPRAAEVTGSGSAPQHHESRVRKLAGVLGETSGLGAQDPQVIIGIGINADWRRDDFPADLVDGMTSLRDASGGRPIDRVQLLDAFLGRIEARVEGLRRGHFALSDWQDRQITTGRFVDLIAADGSRETLRAVGVDSHSGGLVVEDVGRDGRDRVVHTGEILHVRLAATGL